MTDKYYLLQKLKHEEYMKHENKFDLIRQWGKDKGILDKATLETQFEKLLEEVEEVRVAIKKKDRAEFIDGIGDSVVVLTLLAALDGLKIEDCINTAYDVISKRTGKMVDGVFVKDK